MSDIGLFPPGFGVWIYSLGWIILCAAGLLICLLIAWLRTRRSPRALHPGCVFRLGYRRFGCGKCRGYFDGADQLVGVVRRVCALDRTWHDHPDLAHSAGGALAGSRAGLESCPA